MNNIFKRFTTKRRGNAVLETAIVLPVLLSLAFCTLALG
jgi:Flp pilus assembly protein TadG